MTQLVCSSVIKMSICLSIVLWIVGCGGEDPQTTDPGKPAAPGVQKEKSPSTPAPQEAARELDEKYALWLWAAMIEQFEKVEQAQASEEISKESIQLLRRRIGSVAALYGWRDRIKEIHAKDAQDPAGQRGYSSNLGNLLEIHPQYAREVYREIVKTTPPKQLDRLCEHMLEHGFAEEALQYAPQIESEHARFRTFLTLADIMLARGEKAKHDQLMKEVRKFVDAQEDPDQKARVQREVDFVQQFAGPFEIQKLERLDAPRDEQGKFTVKARHPLLQLARLYHQRGDQKSTREVFAVIQERLVPLFQQQGRASKLDWMNLASTLRDTKQFDGLIDAVAAWPVEDLEVFDQRQSYLARVFYRHHQQLSREQMQRMSEAVRPHLADMPASREQAAALQFLARLAQRRKDQQELDALLADAAKWASTKPLAGVAEHYGRVFLNHDRIQDLRALCERTKESEQEHPKDYLNCRYLLLRALARDGAWEEAENLARSLPPRYGNSPLCVLIYERFRQNGQDEAKALLEEVVKGDGESLAEKPGARATRTLRVLFQLPGIAFQEQKEREFGAAN